MAGIFNPPPDTIIFRVGHGAQTILTRGLPPIESPLTAIHHDRYRFHATMGEQNDAKVPLPGKPYVAVRLTRIAESTTRPAPAGAPPVVD